jgi:hypothetical protein
MRGEVKADTGGITRDDPHRPKVVCHRAIRNGFLADCGHKIVVDDLGRRVFPVEIETN